MARRSTLVTSPEPTSTFIAAPRILVRHLATGAVVGVFPMTKHELAREIARRWRCEARLLPVEPCPAPSARASRKGAPA